ncbi:hypothetical protein EE612_008185, partial [Oryza sativa]
RDSQRRSERKGRRRCSSRVWRKISPAEASACSRRWR